MIVFILKEVQFTIYYCDFLVEYRKSFQRIVGDVMIIRPFFFSHLFPLFSASSSTLNLFIQLLPMVTAEVFGWFDHSLENWKGMGSDCAFKLSVMASLEVSRSDFHFKWVFLLLQHPCRTKDLRIIRLAKDILVEKKDY